MSSSSMEEVSVSTATATATTTGHHLLKLEGYRLLKGMYANGKCFESCRFKAAGHTWKIRCYPNGNRKENAGFLSLYLVRDDAAAAAPTAIHADVELALVHHHVKLLLEPPFSRSYTHTFGRKRRASRWGFGRFIRDEELQSRGFLKEDDDCLAVRCKITVVEKSARVICKCNDDGLCNKGHHQRPNKGLIKKAFLRFCRSFIS